jgi:thioredoxin reductase
VTNDPYHVAIIGGGPAGLAGALRLARYRQSVLLLDAGNPRNRATWAVHGYLGLDDPNPMELRQAGLEQARRAGAEYTQAVVARVVGTIDDFTLTRIDGEEVRARRVLFATGLRDIIPEIRGLIDFYGSSIWHCPDCDGPGAEGLRLGVIGWGRQIAAFCMEMLTWTDQLTIYTHGREPELPPRAAEALARFGIPVETGAIARLEGEADCVQRVVMENGAVEPVDAMFFHIAYGPGSSLPAELGCEADEDGILRVDDDHQTSVPGVFAAGDIVRGSKLAIRAAAVALPDGTRVGGSNCVVVGACRAGTSAIGASPKSTTLARSSSAG